MSYLRVPQLLLVIGVLLCVSKAILIDYITFEFEFIAFFIIYCVHHLGVSVIFGNALYDCVAIVSRISRIRICSPISIKIIFV